MIALFDRALKIYITSSVSVQQLELKHEWARNRVLVKVSFRLGHVKYKSVKEIRCDDVIYLKYILKIYVFCASPHLIDIPHHQTLKLVHSQTIGSNITIV